MGCTTDPSHSSRLHFVAVHHQDKEMICSLKKQRSEMEKTVTEFYKNAREIFEQFSAKHKEERKQFVARAKKMKKLTGKYAWN